MIILSIFSLFGCSVISRRQVPPQIKPPFTCQYKDFFYSYFYCDKLPAVEWNENTNTVNKCIPFRGVNDNSRAIFLLYDVNSVEGFNLRRDVYIRMAVFVKSLRQRKNYENSFLVLPPFYQLYHWNLVSSNRYRSNEVNDDEILFWNHFFDMESMKRYTAVLDLWEYFEIMRDCFGWKSKSTLDYVFRLKHFESMFQSRKFEEKYEIQANCDQDSFRNRGQFISLYSNFSINQVQCVEFQGSAGLLYNLLEKYPQRYSHTVDYPFPCLQGHFVNFIFYFSPSTNTHSITLLNAETVLHDYWGGTEYWMVRRSMRFNSFLVDVANTFRSEMLNSTDAFDATERPNDWRDETVNIDTLTLISNCVFVLCCHSNHTYSWIDFLFM